MPGVTPRHFFFALSLGHLQVRHAPQRLAGGRPRDFLAGRDSVVDPSPARACLANIVEAVWPLGAWWWW